MFLKVVSSFEFRIVSKSREEHKSLAILALFTSSVHHFTVLPSLCAILVFLCLPLCHISFFCELLFPCLQHMLFSVVQHLSQNMTERFH